MNAQQAIENLSKHDGDRKENISVLLAEVEPLCKTATDGDTTLEEWLSAGEFHADDTPAGLAEEWDDLEEE